MGINTPFWSEAIAQLFWIGLLLITRKVYKYVHFTSL